MAENSVERWSVLYPAYFDSDKSLQQGRRLPKNLCISHPQAEAIGESAKRLGLPVALQSDKKYCRDPTVTGRVRVQLKQDDKLILESVTSKYHLLRAIGKLLPIVADELKANVVAKNVTKNESASSSNTGTAVAGLPNLQPRKKKKKGKK